MTVGHIGVIDIDMLIHTRHILGDPHKIGRP